MCLCLFGSESVSCVCACLVAGYTCRSKWHEKAKEWFEKDGGKRFPSPYGPRLQPWATKMAKKYAKQVATMMLREKPEAALKILTEAGDADAINTWHQTYGNKTA